MKRKIIAQIAIVAIFTVFFIGIPILQLMIAARLTVFPYNTMYTNGNHSIMTSQSPHSLPYKTSTVDISFDYAAPINWTQISSFSYSLNETSLNETVHGMLISSKWSDAKYNVYDVFGTLRDLPNGNYSLIEYANYDNGTAKTLGRDRFTVDTNFVEPTLRVISPINQATYHSTTIELIYSVNSKVIWSYYALDSSAGDTHSWISFKGNITIANLSEGSHKILVAVQAEENTENARHTTQQTIYFTIDS